MCVWINVCIHVSWMVWHHESLSMPVLYILEQHSWVILMEKLQDRLLHNQCASGLDSPQN